MKLRPDWAATLTTLHGKPSYLRYVEGIHGMVLPNTEPMTPELIALTEIVREELRLSLLCNHACYQKQSEQ